MNIKVSLEWFLNPDHLPMVAGVVTGAYEKAGLAVEIIQPEEHYDGFEELNKGAIDIHCNEPLHLFEHYFDGIKSLGCFFETRGGVMIRKDRVEKLKANGKIKITTPAANPVTDKIGFEIIKRYAEKNGFVIDRENVEFVETDFWHLNNMKADESFDGAWLCFYNFEGVEAEMENFENLFIDQFESPYPNFSALEFMTSAAVAEKKGDALCTFTKVTQDMTAYIKANPQEARNFYYEYTKEEPSELMDNIIKDTITRFQNQIKADGTKWRDLYKFLEELELVKIDDAAYDKIWTIEATQAMEAN
jgi:putative hydroxymethylpyrimidine transport system substrate-binding protein